MDASELEVLTRNGLDLSQVSSFVRGTPSAHCQASEPSQHPSAGLRHSDSNDLHHALKAQKYPCGGITRSQSTTLQQISDKQSLLLENPLYETLSLDEGSLLPIGDIGKEALLNFVDEDESSESSSSDTDIDEAPSTPVDIQELLQEHALAETLRADKAFFDRMRRARENSSSAAATPVPSNSASASSSSSSSSSVMIGMYLTGVSTDPEVEALEVNIPPIKSI